MTTLKITQEGVDVTDGISYEIDIGKKTKEIEYKLENTSSFLECVDIKFITNLPVDSYKIIKMPEKIESGRTGIAVISYKIEDIFGLAAQPIPRKSKFTYTTVATMEF